MSIATDVSAAQKWCNEARKILGKKILGKSDNTRMKDANDSIRKRLDNSTGELPDKVHKSFEDRYLKLAGTAHDIAKSTVATAKKQKDLEPIVKDIIKLDTELAGTIKKHADYTKQKGQAEKNRDELAKLNFDKLKYETLVANAIQRSGVKAGQDPPDYDSALADLNRAQQEYARQKEKAKTDLKNFETYTKDKDKAEEKCRELKVLKHGKQEYHGGVETAINNAEAEAAKDPPDFAAAVKALEKVDETYKAAKKQAEDDVSGDLGKARHEPVYTDKANRIRAAIEELKPLPGAGDQVKKLAALLKAGDDEVQRSGNYEEAYKKLKGLTSVLKEGREASEKLVTKGGGDKFQAARKEALAAIDKYDELAGLTDTKGVAELRKDYDDYLRTLEGKPGQKVIDKALQDMNTLRDKAKGKADDFGDDYKTCESSQKAARTVVSKVNLSAPVDVYEKLLAGLREGEALMSAQNLKAAIAKFDDVVKKGDVEEKKYYPKYEEWDKLAEIVDRDYLPELQKVHQELLLKEAGGTLQVLTAYASAKETVDRTKDFAGAITAAQAVWDTVEDTIRPALRDYEALESVREEGIKQLDGLFGSVEGRIKNLEQQKGDSEEYKKAYDKAVNAWRDARDTCTKKDKLEAAIKACHDEMFRIGDELGDLLRNKDGSLDAHKQKAAPKIRKKEFDQQLGELRKAVQRLAGEFPADAKPFETELTNLEKIAQPGDDDFKKITETVDGVKKKEEERSGERDSVADTLKDLGRKCVDEAKKLRSAHKEFKDYLNELDLEIKDLVSMAGSSVKSVVEEGKKRLDAMLKDLPKQKADLDDIAKRLEDAEKKLKDDQCKKLFPLKTKTLAARLENAVQPECYRLDPKTAKESVLVPFETDLKEFLDAVQKAVDTRKDIDKLVKEIRASLEKQLKDSPKLKASFEGKLKAAEEPGENGETKALEDLKKLQKLVEKCVEDTPEANGLRTTLEQRAKQQEFRSELEQKKWEAALDVFKKNTQRTADELFKGLARAERNTKAYKSIAKGLEEAEKLAKKGSYAQANDSLDEVRKTAERFIGHPYTDATTARNKLKKVEQRWASDVADYIGKLNRLCESIEKDLTEDQVAPTAIEAKLKPVRDLVGLFDAGIFKSAVDTLCKPLPKEPEDILKVMPTRREMKEVGLRHVARYQKAVESNSVLKYLEKNNPFVKSADADFSSGISDCLHDLELNLKRA